VATNVVADSILSSASLEMYAAIIPAAPISLQKQSASTEQVTIEWTAPSENGGTTLTSYKIYSYGGGVGTSSDFAYIGEVTDVGSRVYVHDVSATAGGETF
jgi:hypothetical protein